MIAQVREAPLQKVVAGVGFTTDSGPRVSLDHVHNQMPLLGWRAVSKLSIDQKTQSLGTDWNAIPDDTGWRWFGSGLLKHETAGTYDTDSGRLRAGRGRTGDRIELQPVPAVRLRDQPAAKARPRPRRPSAPTGAGPDATSTTTRRRRAARGCRWNWAWARR